MIVDGHAYCFTAPDTTAGHATVADHMQFWQRGHALHHQPAFRLRDRAPGDALVLLDPMPNDPFRLSTKRNFRVDRVTNRLVWTADGEDYTKHFLPPNTIEFSAGSLIAEMDYAGIDWALLHTDPTLGKDAAFVGACVRAYPNRLRAMAPIDEWLITSDPDSAIRQAYVGVKEHGLHALKIIPGFAYWFGRAKSFDDVSWRPFWDAVTKLGVPFFFTLNPKIEASDPRQSYLEELGVLRRWLDRYPNATVGITHGFPWRAFLNDGKFDLPDSMWLPFKDSSLSMEVCFPVRIGDILDYPYRQCQHALESMARNIGPDRLFWGTDMPFQNRFCTYRQSRSWIERYCQTFLSPQDLSKIMGGTAARILGLQESRTGNPIIGH